MRALRTALLAALVSTSVQAGEITPHLEEAPCPDGVGVREAECFFLVVPETRGSNDGRSLRLAVARLPATETHPAPDPVIYLHGGPGGSALRSASLWEGNPLRRNRDLYLLDQRGVGESEPVLCPELNARDVAPLVADLDVETDHAQRLEAQLACRDSLLEQGVDLGAYNSDASAADVEDLRQALGHPTWNLYGVSYGTKLALQILRNHPAGVRSVVLDSVYPPGVHSFEMRNVDFARSLDVLFRRCAAHPACATTYPDLEQRLWRALENLETDPLPIPVARGFPLDAEAFVLNAQDATVTLHQLLYLRRVFPLVPFVISVLERREAAALEGLVDNLGARALIVNRATYNAVECYERAPFSTREGYRRRSEAHPELQRWFTYFDLEFTVCERWSKARAAASEVEPVRSDVPALLLAGEWDPITPPAWAVRAAQTLPRSHVLEFPGVGHAVAFSHDCPRDLVAEFLEAPDRQPDASCREQMTQPDFVTDVLVNPGVYRFATEVLRGESPGAGIAAAGTGTALLSAVLGWPVAALLRRRRRAPKPTRSLTRARVAAASASFLALALGLGLVAAVASTAVSQPVLLAFGLDGAWAPLFWLPGLVLVALGAAVLTGWELLRTSPSLTTTTRIHHLLVLLALLGALALWCHLGL